MLDFLHKKHYAKPVKFDHEYVKYGLNNNDVDINLPKIDNIELPNDKEFGYKGNPINVDQKIEENPQEQKTERKALDDTEITWVKGKVALVNGTKRRRRGAVDLSCSNINFSVLQHF